MYIPTTRLEDDLDKAERLVEAGLVAFPFWSILLHAQEQIRGLRAYLADPNPENRKIINDFDLGLMAAKELDNLDDELAGALHMLARRVDVIRSRFR